MRKRPDKLTSKTYQQKLPCSNQAKMYVTCSTSDDGEFQEVFSWIKRSPCHKAFLEGLARLINLCYAKGASTEEIGETLDDIKCGTTKELISCPEFIGHTLMKDKEEAKNGIV